MPRRTNIIFDKNRLKVSLFFWFCIFSFSGYILKGAFCEDSLPGTSKVITLKDAIGFAFSNNKDLQIQQKEVEASKANIVSARSNFLPKLNANYSYTHNKKVPTPQNIYTGFNDDNLFSLSLNENLFNGGADWANFKQSLLNLNVQNETLRAKKLDVEFEAKRLYYGLLLAIETARIAQEQVDLAKAHYEDVKKMFEQGTASRFDVLQSSVQVSLLMPELVKANNNIKLITAELNKLLGFKVDDPITPKEKLTYTLIDIKEGEFLQISYLNKPEMALKSLGIDINKWSINMAKAGYRPQIGLNGEYLYHSNDAGNMFNSTHNNWNAGIQVSMPIFDSNSSKAKVDMARSRYAQALLDKANLVDQIAVDVRQACLNLRESETIINSQKDNVGEAREALRLAIVSYDNGVKTNLDVMDAQVSLGNIQNNLAQGIYDYLMAEASLDRTMGKSYVVKGVDDEKKS